MKMECDRATGERKTEARVKERQSESHPLNKYQRDSIEKKQQGRKLVCLPNPFQVNWLSFP